MATPTLTDVLAAIARLQLTATQTSQTVNLLSKKVDILMSQQDDINTDEQTIAQAVTDLGTAATAIQAELDALKAANPTLNLTALDAQVALLHPAVASVAALAPPAAPAA